jgi:hypothetical protein
MNDPELNAGALSRRRRLRGPQLDCVTAVPPNQECPGDKSPSPPFRGFRGEREGPNPQGWEGEVDGAADRHVGPPHPVLSPRPAGGEGKKGVVTPHDTRAGARR